MPAFADKPTVPATRPHFSPVARKFTECRTLFMLCDIQEKLSDKIPGFHDAVHVTNNLTLFCEILGPKYCSCIATIQYPAGVGPLYHDIILPPNTPVFTKAEPSMLIPEVLPYLYGDAERGILPVEQVVLWGHETEVCIMITADELLRRGFRVTVVTDGCGAQRTFDHDVALMEMAKWEGLMLTGSTSLFTQLLRADPKYHKAAMKVILDRGHQLKRPYLHEENKDGAAEMEETHGLCA